MKAKSCDENALELTLSSAALLCSSDSVQCGSVVQLRQCPVRLCCTAQTVFNAALLYSSDSVQCGSVVQLRQCPVRLC